MFSKWHVYPQREVMAIFCTWIAANEKWLLERTYWQPGRILSPSPCRVPSMACGGFWMMLWVFFFILCISFSWRKLANKVGWHPSLISSAHIESYFREAVFSFRNKDLPSIIVHLAHFLFFLFFCTISF